MTDEQVPPEELYWTPQQLRALAREQGAAALETIRQALERAELAEAAVVALGEIPTQSAWDLLEEMAQDRRLRKTARRAQHRLRSRGFRPVARERPPTPPAEEVLLAQVSNFDYVGSQLLRLVRQASLGMRRFVTLLLSPTGLRDAYYVLIGRVDVEAILRDQEDFFGGRLILVDVEPGYIARRLRQAAERNNERGNPLPEDYFDARTCLEGFSEDPWAEKAAAMAPLSGRPSQRELDALFRHPLLREWYLPEEHLDSYAERWEDLVEVNPIEIEGVLNLGMLRARGALTEQIIKDRIDEEARRRWEEQLYEQGVIFLAMGEEALARTALLCWQNLQEEQPADNLFLRHLVAVSMARFFQIEREIKAAELEEEQWGGLWIPRPPEEEDEESPLDGLWLPGR